MSIQVKEHLHPSQCMIEKPGPARVAAAVLLTAAAFLFAYRSVIAALVGQWLAVDMNRHGFLIPVISAYLVWAKRREIREAEAHAGNRGGLALLAAGLAILLAGDMGNSIILQELSLPVTLAGIVCFVLSFEFLKIVRLPIAYLIFMIPVWTVVTEPLVPSYQKMSAVMGAFVMQAVGIPVHRSGLFIELPNITLEVAKACSGIRYMIAVVAIGIPLGYLYLRSWQRRTALIALGLAIATIFNGVRIGIIGIMSYYGISSALHGPGHILQGLSVSASGFAALFGGLWLLSDRPAVVQDCRIRKAENTAPGNDRKKQGRSYRMCAALAILALTGLVISLTRPAPVPPDRELKLLPYQMDRWQGKDAEPVFPALRKMGFDHELARRYRGPSGETVNVFVGYLEAQEPMKKLAGYLTGEFHKKAHTTRMSTASNNPVDVNELIMPGKKQDMNVLFWYEIGEEIITSRAGVTLATAINRLTGGGTNGAFVLVASTLSTGTEAPAARLFAERFIPELHAHVTTSSIPDHRAPQTPAMQ